MTKKLLTILAAAAVLLLIAGVGVLLPHPAAPAAETAAPAAQETPAPVAQEMPAREALIEGYLRTAGSFHPGTAGSSLNRARAACDKRRYFPHKSNSNETDTPARLVLCPEPVLSPCRPL